MKPSAQQRGVASHTNGAHGRREYSDCCGCLVGVWAHDCVCCSFVPPIVQVYPTKKLSRPHHLCNCVVALDPGWPQSFRSGRTLNCDDTGTIIRKKHTCTPVFLATRSVTVTRNLILLADDTVSLTLYGDWDLVTESD